MELIEYIRILRKRWILIVGTVVVALAVAGVYSFTVSPQYTATTRLFVSASTDTSSAADLSAGNTFTSQRVKSYAEAVETSSVLEPVIHSLGLPMTVGELAGHVQANAPLNTVLLEISVTDTDATRAATIANAIGTTLPTVVDQIERSDASGASPVKVSTLQEATVPGAPSSPNKKLNLALGLLVGLALGVGTAVLRETLDNKVRTPRDVEHLTKLPVIGGVPADSVLQEKPLVVAQDPTSTVAEAFRAMRTNIQFVTIDRTTSLVLTSATASEGKTTTVTNLAIAAAQSTQRTLLVDADLRRPRVAAALGIEGSVGLSDVLAGSADVDDVIQPWGEDELLHVLPAGAVPPNPSELLGSQRMRDLIARLENDYDLVLLDCAPVLPVTDAVVLSTIVGGTVVVAASGEVTRNQVAGAVHALGAVDAHVVGAILTKLPTKGPDAYSYNQYGYYTDYSGATKA